jgi:hypothetical protein
VEHSLGRDPSSPSHSLQPFTVYLPKTLLLISLHPFLPAFRSYLTQLYRVSTTPTAIPLERYVRNIVQEVPFPPCGIVEVSGRGGGGARWRPSSLEARRLRSEAKAPQPRSLARATTAFSRAPTTRFSCARVARPPTTSFLRSCFARAHVSGWSCSSVAEAGRILGCRGETPRTPPAAGEVALILAHPSFVPRPRSSSPSWTL